MKPRTLYLALALSLFSIMAILADSGSVMSPLPAQSPAAGSHAHIAAPSLSGEQRPGHCTVFYAADDQVALGGNNEDCFNPRTRIWFLPPEQGKYGLAVVGYEDLYPQGAVNDQGLFFDGLAVTNVNVPREPGKPVYTGNIAMKAMQECGTVDCVLQLYDLYSLEGLWNGQLLFGDSSGNSVIIEPLTNVRKEGRYQVATNFYQSQVKPEDRTDRRYTTATAMFEQAGIFSVDLFRDILDATHQEGSVHTLYSTIYDLKQGIIYLYFFHDFEHVVELDLKKELAKGIHVYDIPSLFAPSTAALAFGESVTHNVTSRLAALDRAQVSPGLLATYAGKYEVTPDTYILVKSESGQIFARDNTMPWVELIPVSEAHFAQVISDGMGQVREIGITFTSQAGKVTGLEYRDGAGHKTVALREGVSKSTSTAGRLWFLVPLLLAAALLAGLIVRRRSSRRPPIT